MKTVLIAGGAGFIGSHLCERLLDEGYKVIAIDNLSTGSILNIKHLMSRNTFQFEEVDILKEYSIPCDYVLNFACPASPPKYQADPINTIKVNLQGTTNLLELAQKNDAVFLQASTSEVYGDPEVHPQPESYRGSVNTVGPRACYDEGKRISETLCYEFRNTYDLDTKIIRIFNTYGPRMDPEDGRVISNFLNQALSGKALTLYGSGEQTRSFTFVDDLVEAIFRVMLKPKSFTGPINLGSEFEYSIAEIAKTVVKLFSSDNVDLRHLPLPKDDPRQRRPKLDMAVAELNWHPETNLEEGLTKTFLYFKNLQQLKSA